MLAEIEFSEEFAKRLIEKVDGLKIYSISGLEVQTKYEKSNEFKHFLNNAYSEYLREPEDIENIFLKYLNSADSIYRPKGSIKITDILPVIKDERFLHSLKEISTDFELNHIYEKYNNELYIFYVEDTETNINYLTKDDFEKLNIEMEGLRKNAIENLSNSVEIQKYGEDGYYMLIADGNYESSLILLDIWNEENFKVKGEIIIGIPSRDVLLVTGKNAYENIERLSNTIDEINESGDHLVCKKIFQYNNGQFE